MNLLTRKVSNMVLLTVIIAVISFYEIRAMWKEGLKKEIAVFTAIAILTLTYGYYYYANIRTASLVRNIFDFIGIKY